MAHSPPPTRLTVLRRLVSLLLILCFGLYSAEALVTDVHDDGAAHMELLQAGGDSHAGQQLAAGHVTAALADAHLTPAHAPAGSGDAGHQQHVCHCAHAHGAWSPVPEVSMPVTVAAAGRQAALDAALPPSPPGELPLRPPIA